MRIINKLIYAIGLFTIGLSWVQWFFRFPDTSQLAIGTSLGIVFLGFGYVYTLFERIGKIEKQIEGIIKFYTKEEFE